MYFQRREKENNVYVRLQQESTELLQRLSGNRWTDFNEHDPGVTLADALHYALFECNYRTSFDLEEYAARPADGKLRYDRIGLLPGKQVFAESVVSPADYERLIEKHIPEVETCEVVLSDRRGYTIGVTLTSGGDAPSVLRAVRALYHRHRNLGEWLACVTLANQTEKQGGNRVHALHSVKYKQEAEEIDVFGRNEGGYRSVQHELPPCYGINNHGLSADASPERKAMALQLKGYLLLFDYLLSGFYFQTRHIDRVLELSGRIPSGFDFDMDIRDMDLLLDTDRAARSEFFREADLHEQKAAYFDFLDGLYGESTWFARRVFGNPTLPEANRHRAELIRLLPVLNARRSRSFNVTDGTANGEMPAVKRFIAALFRVWSEREVSLKEVFGRHDIRLVSDKVYETDMKKLLGGRYYREDEKEKDRFAPLARTTYEPDKGRMLVLFKRYLTVFRHHTLSGSFLERGVRPENYKSRRYSLSSGTLHGYTLLYRPADADEWMGIGQFPTLELLTETANRLCDFLLELRGRHTPCYILEHALLLPLPAERDRNRVSVVVPAWLRDELQKDNYLFQDMIEARFPVHLNVVFRWLDAETYCRFESLYFEWRAAWAAAYAETDRREVERISTLLRDFL